ncbi:MAG: hypothetical protein RL417_363 [Pseudomonadota bacterium]|jgi:hypothetical protein
MVGLNRLSIQSKMIAILLAVSLASICAVAVLAYSSAKEALTQATDNHLRGIQV